MIKLVFCMAIILVIATALVIFKLTNNVIETYDIKIELKIFSHITINNIINIIKDNSSVMYVGCDLTRIKPMIFIRVASNRQLYVYKWIIKNIPVKKISSIEVDKRGRKIIVSPKSNVYKFKRGNLYE